MNERSLQWTSVVLAAILGCGGGGKTSDSDTSTSSPQTTTDPSTSAALTTSAGTGSSGGGSNSATDTGPTSGTPGTSTSSSTGSTGSTMTGPGSSTGEPGTTTTGGTSTGGTSTGATSTGGTDTTGGGVCSEQGKSCAMGEACCMGLECCAGVPVPPGMEFCSNNCPISDRNAKTEFAAIDGAEVLRRVVGLEITTWRYKKDPAGVRHLGPMAQDFKDAFGLGDTDRMIFPLDATGVSMAAIQALAAENAALRGRLDELERRMAALDGGDQRARTIAKSVQPSM
jgi:hypothetical protein